MTSPTVILALISDLYAQVSALQEENAQLRTALSPDAHQSPTTNRRRDS